MRLHDISPAITPDLAVFPGDTPPSREVLLDMARGDPLTLSTLRATAHLGAHADGANHYGLDAPSIDAMPLAHYIGPCRVVAVDAARGSCVTPDQLADALDGPIAEPRVLIRTGTQPDKRVFNPDFAALSPELIALLDEQGVITVGIDTPSVDRSDSKDLPAHHAVLCAQMAIIEGLVLDDVPPGRYELIALPLRLVGFDASPVRAVLRELG